MVEGSLEAYRQVTSSENKNNKKFPFFGVWVWGLITIFGEILGQKHVFGHQIKSESNQIKSHQIKSGRNHHFEHILAGFRWFCVKNM